ncbi:MAG: excinuclease ABC subunit UvrA [Euryarchaeota archaeon]|nr:excinuclease ABC subunit UvrA [Euryarchaeota archaeon]
MDSITIVGAEEHNLKKIDLKLPRDTLIVVTGVSGSGKSSLAFDTLYAEGQRRYVESLSAYARQFLGQMEKPEVEYIEGLSPSISIEQKGISKNPRSTVGTVTEIYDYLRLLFARVGMPHCPSCGKEIRHQTSQEIIEQVMERGGKIAIFAPIARGKKGEYKEEFNSLRDEGFGKVRVDGKLHDLTEEISLEKQKKHTIEVLIDRITLEGSKNKTRVADSIELALKVGKGLVLVSGKEDHLFSEEFACPECGISFGEIEPRIFSFNSPYGACPECDGLGYTLDADPDLIVTNPEKSIMEGGFMNQTLERTSWRYQSRKAVADHYDAELTTPLNEMDPGIVDAFLYGSGDEKIRFSSTVDRGGRKTHWATEKSYEGLINAVRRLHEQTKSESQRRYYEQFMSTQRCSMCNGKRLKKESLAITINGKNIIELTEMPIKGLFSFFESLELTKRSAFIARQILKEIQSRLEFLTSVGLEYLALERKSATLSGGEAERIRLATQIGSQLVGVLYILDEPTIGLHQRDNARLIHTLQRLRDLGNTVIVIEHDESMIRSADHIVDMGPGAGEHGGEVVAQGDQHEIMANDHSLTGKYLKGELTISVPEKRKSSESFLTITDVQHNNLKNITVEVPLGVFVCVTGVSGSGKSSLINDTLYKALARRLYSATEKPGAYGEIHGLEYIDKVIVIDQSPIGRTPRSNPATYTGALTPIRDLFAALPESKVRGYRKGRFSFNVKGGRCEACNGHGMTKIEMHFLPDIYVPCEVCKGKRFNKETLEIRYKGKNIADVLDMGVEEALDFFKNIPKVKRVLQTLQDVGMGYIKLGQPSTTLSGGEAQRIKLSKELSKRSTGKTLYILDEPTTGLHFDDIKKLLKVLNRLVDTGNTVLVIEHNLDVIKNADYIIDLGPEGGDEGGYVIATGTPEEIVKEGTYTGEYLERVLD